MTALWQQKKKYSKEFSVCTDNRMSAVARTNNEGTTCLTKTVMAFQSVVLRLRFNRLSS